ncbi:MAG: type II secretion system F family protein [Holosporales bacterium]|jgi:type IV pilus assembly protein PilC|nr:type II secretion system F family protein [Holosporales bacterium]
MILFKYRALTEYGKIVEKLQIAKDKAELHDELQANGILLISAKKCSFLSRNPITEFTVPFLKNLHQLIANSFDLMTALDVSSQLTTNRGFGLVISRIIADIKMGAPFSVAISNFGEYFDGLVIKSITVAEKTARMKEALAMAVEYLETKRQWSTKFRNAVRYPVILLCCVTCVILFWILFIIPKFADLFRDVGIDMPLMTRTLLKFSTFLTDHYICVGMFTVGLILGTLRILSSHAMREKLLRRVPGLRTIRRELSAMNFFFSMEMMVHEKINLLECLECLANIENSNEITNIVEFIRNGHTLSSAMKRSGLFARHEISLIVAGENAGDLCSAFKSGADILRVKLDDRAQRLAGIIQPSAVVLIGLLLAIIIYSVIIPMYSNLDFNM